MCDEWVWSWACSARCSPLVATNTSVPGKRPHPWGMDRLTGSPPPTNGMAGSGDNLPEDLPWSHDYVTRALAWKASPSADSHPSTVDSPFIPVEPVLMLWGPG